MNGADAITVFRTLLIFPIAYLILTSSSAWIALILIAVMFILDAVDGLVGTIMKSRGRLTVGEYLKATLLNDRFARDKVSRYRSISGTSYGPRLDVAGDRVVEYTFWILFTYLSIIPLFILLIIVIRHSFVDALMGTKGTSSHMKTKFARLVYSSNLGRGGINVVKAVAFGYLALITIDGLVVGWYLLIGYVLVATLFVYVMLRGAAEIYESTKI